MFLWIFLGASLYFDFISTLAGARKCPHSLSLGSQVVGPEKSFSWQYLNGGVPFCLRMECTFKTLGRPLCSSGAVVSESQRIFAGKFNTGGSVFSSLLMFLGSNPRLKAWEFFPNPAAAKEKHFCKTYLFSSSFTHVKFHRVI